MGIFHTDRHQPPEQKFYKRIHIQGECWIWQAGLSGRRPTLKHNKKIISAVRLSYTLQTGLEIPSGHEAYLTCSTSLCVRHVAIRKRGTRPVHPNSIKAVRDHCGNAALPVAKKIRIYFHSEHLSNEQVSKLTGVGVCNVQRLRSTRTNLPESRTSLLRSLIRREGVDRCVAYLCGYYPPCPTCTDGSRMTQIDRRCSRAKCRSCSTSKKVNLSRIRSAPIKYTTPTKMTTFLELIAAGKPSRQAIKVVGMASVTVPKIRKLLIEEFGPIQTRELK